MMKANGMKQKKEPVSYSAANSFIGEAIDDR